MSLNSYNNIRLYLQSNYPILLRHIYHNYHRLRRIKFLYKKNEKLAYLYIKILNEYYKEKENEKSAGKGSRKKEKLFLKINEKKGTIKCNIDFNIN